MKTNNMKNNMKKIKQKNIKQLIDSGYWKDSTSEYTISEKSNMHKCPNCKSSNTRRIQNALTFIKNAPFHQGSEWLGYCHDCGTLYEYYTEMIMNVPIKSRIESNNICPNCKKDETIAIEKDGWINVQCTNCGYSGSIKNS